MPGIILQTIAIGAVCFSVGGLAVASERSHHASHRKQATNRAPGADRDPYADPAAPYKANRLSFSREPILNEPGQSTVLTRKVLDDMNATSLKDALRSTAGVTIGR